MLGAGNEQFSAVMSSAHVSLSRMLVGCDLFIAGSALSLGGTQWSCGPGAGAQTLDGWTQCLKRVPSVVETILGILGWPENLPLEILSPTPLLFPLKSNSVGVTAVAKDESGLVLF